MTVGEIDWTRRRLLKAGMVSAALCLTPLLDPRKANAGIFAVPSPGDQKKIGDEAAKQVVKDNKEIFDNRAKHFQSLGERLVSALSPHDQTTWDYRFHVLDSKEINAFALPGGNMFMYTGLYEKLATDDALAGVTGHEMTHVRLQHWAKSYAQEEDHQLGMLAIFTILKVGSTVQDVVSMADSAVGLKFSRHDEQQADAGGLQNMVDAGFNPQGMIQLFQTLQKVSGNGAVMGGDFLSDHPLTSDRIKTAQKTIDEMSKTRTFPALTPLDYKSLCPTGTPDATTPTTTSTTTPPATGPATTSPPAPNGPQ